MSHTEGSDLAGSNGTLKKSRKHFSDVEQELLDNITLAGLILKDLESKADFSEINK